MPTLEAVLQKSRDMVGYAIHSKQRAKRTFVFRGVSYRYLCARYGNAWDNERTIQIPLIWREVANATREGRRVLEVGNVLQHYYPIKHDVLDKYEKAKGTIRIDAVEFSRPEYYDLVVSISTICHIGWWWQGKEPHEPSKVARAMANLEQCVVRGGLSIFSFPLGYNKYLDSLLFNRMIGPAELWYFKRISADNRWAVADESDARGALYSRPFRNGNVIVIATIRK